MNAVSAARRRPSNLGLAYSWARLAAIGTLLLVTAVVYWPTTSSLLAQWTDTEGHTYTHGFLVFGVALWLIFRERSILSGLTVKPMYVALVPIILVGFACVIVQRGGIEIGHQLLLPLMAWLSIMAVFGWGLARLCVYPLGYLYFAIPIWTHINDQLQSLTVAAVQVLLRASGIPAYFAGDLVEIPSGLFEIEDGCSGLHFLIVALALAALFGQLREDRPLVRFRHLFVAGILAIFANWIRVYVIIVAGHLTNMQHYLVRVDHYYFGWLVFAIAMAVFLSTSGAQVEVEGERASSGLTPAMGGSSPSTAALLVTSVALALPPIMARALSTSQPATPGASIAVGQIEGWSGPGPMESGWQPLFSGADQEIAATYFKGDQRLDLYVAVFAEQHQGKELIGYRNSLVSPLTELSRQQLQWQGLQITEYQVVDGKGERWLIWSFYTVGSRTFTSGIASELWYGFRSLRGPVESRAIALRMRCAPDCGSVRDRLGEVLEHAGLYLGLRD